MSYAGRTINRALRLLTKARLFLVKLVLFESEGANFHFSWKPVVSN